MAGLGCQRPPQAVSGGNTRTRFLTSQKPAPPASRTTRVSLHCLLQLGLPVGASAPGAAPLSQGQKKKLKEAQKKEKEKERAEAEAALAAAAKAAAASAPAPASASAATESEETDPVKQRKKLEKKLRQAEELQAKGASGPLNEDQRRKVGEIDALRALIEAIKV